MSTTRDSSNQLDQQLVGIRGWLILPAIGLVLSIIVAPIGLITGLAQMESDYAAYSVPAILVNAGFYIWIWVAAVRFFKKMHSAPTTLIQLMIARIIASVLLFCLGMAVVRNTDPLVIIALLKGNNFIAQGIAAAIWIPYFKLSKRVRATFVNRRAGEAEFEQFRQAARTEDLHRMEQLLEDAGVPEDVARKTAKSVLENPGRLEF